MPMSERTGRRGALGGTRHEHAEVGVSAGEAPAPRAMGALPGEIAQ